MAITYAHGKTTISASGRLLIAGLMGIAALAVTGLAGGSWALAPLVGWDFAALLYTAWIWLTIWPMDGKLTAQFTVREDPSRGVADIVVLFASVASLAAVGSVLVAASGSSGLGRMLQIGLSVLSVILSWTVVHTLFALRYAELYYHEPAGGIDFSGTTQPSYVDFAYLAFTMGMTFQVSDTGLSGKQFRKMALKHAMLSYVFGTVIVATTINLVAGLSK